MKVCFKCGNTVIDELTTCPKCGELLRKEDIYNSPIGENKEDRNA